jgi:hypothetical protein
MIRGATKTEEKYLLSNGWTKAPGFETRKEARWWDHAKPLDDKSQRGGYCGSHAVGVQRERDAIESGKPIFVVKSVVKSHPFGFKVIRAPDYNIKGYVVFISDDRDECDRACDAFYTNKSFKSYDGTYYDGETEVKDIRKYNMLLVVVDRDYGDE